MRVNRFNCGWCDSANEIRAQVSATMIPVICKNCGGKLGYMDIEELNKILSERDYYKAVFYDPSLMCGT